MSDFRRAKTLVKSIRYPTFQFWATANNDKVDANKQIIIAILTSLEWLRTKFSEFSIPKDIEAPEWEKYEDVSFGDFKSVHINEGYTVDIVCLPNQKIWALRLIEPDLSTKLENNIEVNCSVPGRIFQTDIAFAVVNSSLQCGFKITVSEPDTQAEPCKAYRPYLVQVLAENPLLGFKCGYPIGQGTWLLNKVERIKQLRDYLASGNIPAVILCDYECNDKPNISPVLREITDIDKVAMLSKRSFTSLSPIMENLLPKSQSRVIGQEKLEFQYDATSLLKYRTCHAHYFRCTKSMLSDLNKILHIEAKSGDIVLVGTALCGGNVKYFAKTEDPAENIRKVLFYLLDYPNGRPYNYGAVSFYADALLIQMEALNKEQNNESEKIKLLNAEIDILKKKIDELQLEQITEAERHAKKISNLQQTISEANKQMAEIRDDAADRIRKVELERDRYSAKIAYHESLSQRPKKPDGVPQWVEEQFAGRLIFHSKAARLISDVTVDEVDMSLLCDALEYLASEYRDRRLGQISDEEMNRLCSEKYGRPFTVTPTGDGTTEYVGSDYKIKYKIGAKGKPVETTLDLHLKAGNKTGKLLRIYFLYDSEKNLVVVGSLPKHLKTKSYS